MIDHDVRLELRSDPAFLSVGRALVRAYLERHDFCDTRTDEVVLACDEALSNAFRHAYDGAKDEAVVLVMRHDGEYVYIEVSDHGKTAAPEHIERRELSAPAPGTDVTPGGLGVQLIYSVCDKVDFDLDQPEGNRVRMSVKRPDAQHDE